MIGILPSEIVPSSRPLSASIASLFNNGIVGIWVDPNDTSTILTGAPHATQAAVEQTADIVLDKSMGLATSSNLFNGTFTTLNPGWVNNGNGTYTGTTTATTSDLAAVGNFTINAVYEITIELSGLTGSCSSYIGSPTAKTGLTNGINKFYTLANHATYTIIRLAANSSVTVKSLTIKQVYGNHMCRYAASNIPTVSARHNWLVDTEDLASASWTKTNATVSQISGPEWKITPNTTSGIHRVSQVVADSAASALTVELKADGYSKIAITDTNATGVVSYLDLATGNVFGGASNLYVEALEAGWYSVSYKYADSTSAVVSRTWSITVLPDNATNTFGNTAWAANGSSSIRLRKPRVVPCNTLVANMSTSFDIPAYQKVVTATNYDTIGFPRYLSYKGVTGSAHYTPLGFNTSKFPYDLAMWAAVTKYNDTVSVVAELSNGPSVAGQYTLISGSASGTLGGFKATAFTDTALNNDSIALTVDKLAPATAVLASFVDVSEPLLLFKTSATPPQENTAPRGTAGYTSGKYIVLGCREGPSYFFKGQVYGFIVRSAPTYEHHSVKAELYLNGSLPTY